MAPAIFEIVARELERRTHLARLEARGTLRLALREAGLDVRGVTEEQMSAILRNVMPEEMRSRGVERPESICEAIVAALGSHSSASSDAEAEAPDEIVPRKADS